MMHSLAPLLSHREEEERGALCAGAPLSFIQQGGREAGRQGGRGPAAALTQHFHRDTQDPPDACARLWMEAFVRAPPPVQRPAGDRMEARLP